MRRVLGALCLALLSCAILEAKPASKRARPAYRAARTQAGVPQLTARERIWQRLFGTTTMDESTPPPPPRENGPIP